MMKRLMAGILLCGMLILPGGAFADPGIVEARSYWLYEARTRTVLAEYQGELVTPAASLTKLMTGLLVLESLEKGIHRWDETIKLPETYVNPGGSTMELFSGQSVTIRQLFEGLLIVSANDAAQILAAHVGGSEAGFVEQMNSRARQLGLKQTLFINPNGLPTVSGQNMTTAQDIGILCTFLLEHYQEPLLEVTARKVLADSTGKPGKPATNTLMMLKPGVDGFKTGHTDAAGYCLAATIPFGPVEDARLIAVVMGTADEKARDHATQRLLEWAENQYAVVKVIDEKQILDTGLWNGLESRPVKAYADKTVIRLLKKTDRVTTQVQYIPPQSLPLLKGDAVGSVTVQISNGEIIVVPLRSATEIRNLTFDEQVLLLFQTIRHWVFSVLPS